MLLCQARTRLNRAFLCLTFVFAGTLTQTALAQIRYEVPPEPAGFIAERPSPRKDGGSLRPAQEQPRQAADGDLDVGFTPTFDLSSGFAYAVEELPDQKLLVAGGFKSINGVARSGIARLNADGSIDAGFSASIRGSIFRMAVQADGKVVIGGPFVAFNGSTSRSGVARLNTDGSLDTTFDTGSGPDALVRDIILQPDGKLLVAGEFFSINGTGAMGIARLNSDGSVDSTLTSPLVPGAFLSGPAVFSVALQPDGKIILGGAMNLTFGGGQPRWILRLNTNGTVDETFISPSMNSNPWELAVQPDGKIVMVGFFTTVSSTSRGRIARLNADGTLDATFNPGAGANSSALFVRILANGKILVSGTFASINGTPRGGLAQLNSDGALDASFAPNGTTTGTVNSVTSTASGNYYAGGNFSRLSGSDRNTVVLLNGNGSVDAQFVANSLQLASIRSVKVQSDGKLIIGGFFNRVNGAPVNSVVRLTSGGALDPTFASGVTISGSVTRVVVQPDGKLLVLGSTLRVNNGPSQTMMRLNADGTPDNSFTLATIANVLSGISAAVQPDGKILYSYLTTSADPNLSSVFIRLNSDGSIDGLFSAVPRRIESIAVLPNGQVMVAGPFAFAYVDSGGTYEPHNGIMRLNDDGAHDRTFRSALTAEDSNITAAYAMHVQQDGKILVGGRLFVGGSPNPLGIVRLNATGTLDGTFQTTPMTTAFGLGHVYSIHPTADGKLLVGGYFNNYGGFGSTNIVRLQTNGVVDQGFTGTTDNTVSTVATESNGSILIGGSFEKVNGVSRTALARLLTESSTQDSTVFDFDGDGKTDIGIFRPGLAEWWIQKSGDGNILAAQFGATTDKIVPADYTGDGKSDIAVWRPSSGEWYVLRSEDFSFFAFPFGTNGDVPVTCDYDADGKADAAVFRPSSATWFIRRSSDQGTTIEAFGANGDQPVPADYDGDGKADIAIFRPSLGQWWINRSTAGLIAATFGDGADKPVQGDYTGDGKSDVAFWRPSTGDWFVLRSEDSSFFAFQFGTTGDIPAPGDYDGDGRHDATVFRPPNATWYSQRTTAGTLIQQFGSTGDRPVPNAFVP